MKRTIVFIFIIVLILLLGFYKAFIYGKAIYGNKIVYEDAPLGFFQDEYANTTQVPITNLQPEDITMGSLNIEEFERKYDGKVVNWNLIVDSSYDSYTDVIGNCYWTIISNPKKNQSLPIHVRFQGTNCAFWKEIKQGEIVNVIGEINISQGVQKNQTPRRINIYNDVMPMAVKHKKNYYVNTKLPRNLREQLLSTFN